MSKRNKVKKGVDQSYKIKTSAANKEVMLNAGSSPKSSVKDTKIASESYIFINHQYLFLSSINF